MPSLYKAIEDIEYKASPSSTKEGFASSRINKNVKAAQAAAGDHVAKNITDTTANNKSNDHTNMRYEEIDSTNQTQRNPKTNDISAKKMKSQTKALEITSDEEENSLNNLVRLKQSSHRYGESKVFEANVIAHEQVGKSSSEPGKTLVNSMSSMKKTIAPVHCSFVTHSHELAAIKRKDVNTRGPNGPKKSVAISSTSKTSHAVIEQAHLTNSTNTKQNRPASTPYFVNPTVCNNANIIVQNIRANLQQALPLPKPTIEISEHRIDSAVTIEDLDTIRNRLLTLTNRVDLRLKEMLLLKAIGMTENEADCGLESTPEIIRNMVERSVANLSHKSISGYDGKKRKHSQDHSGTVEKKDNPGKPQYFSCCPFCLSTNLPREMNEECTCSICDEKSNICLHCRGYCIKCNRLACESCLMRCDTCLSDTYCTDCIEKTGQCTICMKREPLSKRPKIRALSQRAIPVKAPPASPDHSLHRFIVTEKRTLGLVVCKKDDTVTVKQVFCQSHAEVLGLKAFDEVCFAFSNGMLAVNSYDKFLMGSKCRPMIFEVRRKIEHSSRKILHRFYVGKEGSLGMTVKQIFKANGEQYTLIVAVHPGKLADLHGLCAGDIICKPFTNGVDYGRDVYGWFIECVKRRPLIFDVWRDRTTNPLTTNPETAVPSLKQTQNPFIWSFGDKETTPI